VDHQACKGEGKKAERCYSGCSENQPFTTEHRVLEKGNIV